jgi:hypothetical protein
MLTIKNFKKIENVMYSSQWDFHHVEETDGYYTFTLRTRYHISNKIFHQQIEVNRFPDSVGKHNVLYNGKIYKFRKSYFKTIYDLINAFKKNIK